MMSRKKNKPTLLYLGIMVIGLLALIIALAAQPALADVLPQSAYQQLQAAWQRASNHGQYEYHSNILQTTLPTTQLRNVGRGPQTERVRIDGSLDKATDTMQMAIQLNHQPPLTVKVEDGQSYGRQGAGEEWVKLEQMPDLFAPGGDPLGFLVAMENVRALSPDEAGMEDFSAPAELLKATYGADEAMTRYAFTLSGPKFARFMTAQMEDQLRRKGELPPTLNLSTATQYAAMSGHGEIWVGANGLPMRQLIHLDLPEGATANGQSSAELVTAFDNWRDAPASVWRQLWRDPTLMFTQPMSVIGISGQAAQQTGLTLGLTLLVLGLIALALTHRRLWAVRATVYGAIILAMVITPLLQTQRVSAFYDGQQARAMEAASNNVESAATATFNPHENPVAVALANATSQPAAFASASSALESAAPSANVAPISTTCVVTETSDCDGDGLSDQIEIHQIGTLVDTIDTDGDKISDKAEIQPFTVGGQIWYLDPRSSDSNGDGLADSMECSARVDVVLTEYFATDTYATCPDTDNDGVPDVFDFDNDGDGVPDNIDSSPNNAQSVADKRFGFALAGYGTDHSLSVNLELRPTDDRHLWWADNALDWPDHDVNGQIQRVTDETIQGNGDMRLTPMLEVAIPYDAANPTRGLPVLDGVNAGAVGKNRPLSEWLDQDRLDAYGIVVSGPRAEDGLLYLYAPLNIIKDEVGETPVAFGATLLYEMASSVSSWGADHQMRLLWMVNGLTDSCEAPTDLSANEAEAYCADYANWTSKQTVFQTYYDDFQVTGLTVQDDYGASALLVAQKSTNGAYESDLWHLADTLDDTYLAAQTVNGQRLALSQISDHLSNWGINSDNLYIQPFSDLHDKTALAKVLTGNEVMTALTQSHPNASRGTTANLLFVGEETTVDASLGTAATTFASNTLRVDLTGLDQETTGFVRWNPYQYTVATFAQTVTDPDRGTTIIINQENEQWDEQDVATYAEGLQSELATVLTKDLLVNAGLATTDEDADLVSGGAARLAANYYLTHYVGAPTILENSRFALTGDTLVDSAHVKPAAPVLTIVGRLLSQLQQIFAQQSLTNLAIETDASGGQMVANTTWQTLATSPGVILAGVGALVAGDTASSVTIALATVAAPPAPTTQLTGSDLSDAATLAFTGADLAAAWAEVGTKAGLQTVHLLHGIHAYSKFVAGQRSFQWWDDVARDALGNQNLVEIYRAEANQGWNSAIHAQRSMRFWAAVGLAAEIAAIGIFATYTILTEHLEAGSPAFNQTLAMAYAQAIVAVVTFVLFVVLAAIPGVNLVLAAVLFVDSIVSVACEAAGVKQETTADVGYWLCGGLTGALTKAIAYAVNDTTPLMDMTRPEHLNVAFQDPALTVAGDAGGTAVGNTLQLTATITNTAYAGHPNWMGYFYPWQLDDDNVKAAAVDVRLQTSAKDFDGALSLGSTDWQRPDDLTFDANPPHDGPRFVRSFQRSLDYTMDKAGVNVGLPYYLSEGVKTKTQDCWLYVGPPLFYPIPICQTEESFGNTFHQNLDDFFVMDVFPASLNDFHTLTQNVAGEPGYRLAWDESFPVLRDADGDGLVSKAFNGPDPDDSNPDTDGDGLSDFYEYQNGFDPTNADGDCDGLTDYWELFYNTDPNHRDSDYDGLPDGREIFHPNRQYPYENSALSSANAPACASEVGLSGGYAGGWSMVYAFNGNTPLPYWVSSDPNNPDTDDDGLTDRSEQVYGYNPHAPSELDVLALETKISTSSGLDAYVGLGDSIDYEATITNDLSDRYLRGLLESELPVDTVVKTQEVDGLLPLASTTLDGSVAVANTGLTASTATSMTLRSGVIIDEMPDHLLWLRFNEKAGTTTITDSSVFKNNVTGSNVTANGESAYFPANSSTATATDVAIPSGTSGLSVGVWFKLTGMGSEQRLVTMGPGGPWLYIYAGGTLGGLIEGANIVLRSTATPSINEWHHAALTFDASASRLYLDGELVASAAGSTLPTAPQFVILGDNKPALYHPFYLDNVEIFSRSLSESEIHDSYGRETARFDLTSLGNGVSCDGDRCPSLSRDGASFDQTKDLTLDTSSLTFSNNQFSIAVDVKPVQRPHPFNVEAGSHFGIDTSQDWQAVYGYQDPTNPKLIFPSLYVGSAGALRVDMGDGTNTCSYQTADGIVAFDVEQQVTVSYDGAAFAIYINGEKQASGAPAACNGIQIPNVNQLYAGRPNNAGYFYWDQVTYDYLSDPGNGAELCLNFDVNSTDAALWHDFNVAEVPSNQPRTDQLDVAKRITDDATHWFRFQEDDSNTSNCNYSTAANDDELVYKSGLSNVTTLGSSTSSFNSCFDCDQGTLYWSLSNEFFVGALRNLSIFNYALSAQGAARAYNTESIALQMDFDEAPGETIMVDSSGNYFEASCAGNSCPDSGIPGRHNQALRFDGGVADDDGNDGIADYLAMAATDAALGFDKGSFTLIAWVKPDTATGTGRILAASRAASANGVGFGLRDGHLLFTTFGIKGYQSNLSAVPAGKWSHVAVSFDANYDAHFYVNGQFVETVKGTTPVSPNSDDPYLIGATTPAGSQASSEVFDGLLDDLRILKFAAGASTIQALMNEAPLLNLHLDEDIATTTFVNDAPATATATCTPSTGSGTGGTCPGAGDKGAIRESATFDGVDDRIEVADNDVLDLDEFTIALWVKPSQVRTDYQAILTKESSKDDRNYGLFIHPNNLRLTYGMASNCANGVGQNSTGSLLQNQWNHVVMTYDGAQARVYINGSLDSSVLNVTTPCHNTQPVQIGDGIQRYAGFAGNLDEITIAQGARTAEQVAALYNYQSAWYDKKEQHAILVDADAPVVSVALDSAFIEPGQLLFIDAADPTVNGVSSGIAGVQYSIDGGTFVDAAVDNDAYLIPAAATQGLSEGSHTVQVRATDNVGLSSTSSQVSAAAVGATQTIQVDTTAPNPGPGVNMATDPIQPIRGSFSLYGRATDDQGTVQSGVDTSSVQASLRDHTGALVSGPAPASFVIGPQWQSTHDLGVAPYGQYTFEATAKDKAGNEGTGSSTIWVDGLPGYGDMLINSNIITGTGTVISGLASDIPYPQSGRQAHYHFEEAAGATLFYDGSVNHLNATCGSTGSTSSPTGSPAGSCPTAGTAGQNDSALTFDGNDYLLINNQEGISAAQVLGLNGNFTIMAWVKPAALSGHQRILAAERTASNNGIGFGLDSNQLVLTAFGVKDYYSTLPTGIAVGAWSHIAASYDATTNDVTFYVNGVLLETVNGDADLSVNSDDAYRIGAGTANGSSAPTEAFNGAIDELAVYSTNLSEETIYDVVNPVPVNTSQVKLRYRHASGVVWPNLDPAGLALYLPLDESFGSGSFADLSSYGRDATCDSTGSTSSPTASSTDRCPIAGQNDGLQAIETGAQLEFDGTDDSLTVPPVLDPAATDFTAALWFKVSPLNKANRFILQQADGNGVGRTWLLVTSDGALRSFLGGSTLEHPTKVTTNSWHHAALTYDLSTKTLTLYLDGIPASTTRTLEASDGEMLVGVSRSNSNYFLGNIDEVALFDRALTPTEIGYLGQSPWYDASPVYVGDNGDTLGNDDKLRLWSHAVPAGLEGPYKIDLLVSDGPVPFHREGVSRAVWTGEIDTLAPRIDLSYTVSADGQTTTVTCAATDYNLSETGWVCPVDNANRTSQTIDAAWFTSIFTATDKLVGFAATGDVATATATLQVSACDLFGNCRSTGDGGDTPIIDNDADNIPDVIEDGAPNGGDGNGDGVLDSQQANVTSLPDASGTAGAYVTLASPSGTELVDVSVRADAPAPAPAGVSFPIGHLDFSVQKVAVGGAVTVTLFPKDATRFNTYYKYGATPDNSADHWYEFLYQQDEVGSTGAEIFADRIVLHFVDGGRGDADLTANGVIVDPGAPAFFLSATELPFRLFLPVVSNDAQMQAQAVEGGAVEQTEAQNEAQRALNETEVTPQQVELTHKILLPLVVKQ